MGAARAATVPGVAVYDKNYVYAFGQLCAAELVIQCWRRRPAGGAHGMSIALLSVLIFTCAANTEERHIRYLAPAYFLFLVLAFGAVRNTTKLAWAAVLLALLLGGAVSAGMHIYQRELFYMTTSLIERPPLSETVGLSDAPMLSATNLTRGSTMRVLRVEGTWTEMHCRAMSFDTYLRGAWLPTVYQRALKGTTPAALRSDAPGRRLEMTRLTEDCRYLLAPLDCAGIVPPDEAKVSWDTAHGGPIITAMPFVESYAVILSGKANHQGPLCTPMTAEERARYLALPTGPDTRSKLNPKVLEMAQRIGGNLRNPLARIDAVVAYLQANHTYSLKTDPGIGDPVSNFLILKKSGHCEYFASATVMLLRCLNVPSRYVIGYYVHEPAGKNKMVARGRDSHAWAEAWVDGVGWVTVDATPSDGMPAAQPPVSMFDRIAEWFQDLWATVRSWAARVSWLELLGWSLGAAGAAFAGVTLWRTLRGWRRVRAAAVAVSYTMPDESMRVLAARFEEWMRRGGRPCPSQRTWQEHLAELDPTAPSPRVRSAHVGPLPQEERGTGRDARTTIAFNLEQAMAFVSGYNAARFGATHGTAELARLRSELERMELVTHDKR
jgi:transglutaminase-like putative cysteine protease